MEFKTVDPTMVMISGSIESLVMRERVKMANKSDDYEAIREATDHVVNKVDGKQGGEPEKAALAIIRTAEENNPPDHLLLQSAA